jgi:hypothetical protein
MSVSHHVPFPLGLTAQNNNVMQRTRLGDATPLDNREYPRQLL